MGVNNSRGDLNHLNYLKLKIAWQAVKCEKLAALSEADRYLQHLPHIHLSPSSTLYLSLQVNLWRNKAQVKQHYFRQRELLQRITEEQTDMTIQPPRFCLHERGGKSHRERPCVWMRGCEHVSVFHRVSGRPSRRRMRTKDWNGEISERSGVEQRVWRIPQSRSSVHLCGAAESDGETRATSTHTGDTRSHWHAYIQLRQD